jgi:hypothetical protein
MSTTATTDDTIPPEIRARVECNFFFLAIRDGDYAAAARAQERLRALGWTLGRHRPQSPRRRRSVTSK